MVAMRLAPGNGRIRGVVAISTPAKRFGEVLATDLTRVPGRRGGRRLPGCGATLATTGKAPAAGTLPDILRPIFAPGQDAYLASVLALDPVAEVGNVPVQVLLVRGGADPTIAAADVTRMQSSLRIGGQVMAGSGQANRNLTLPSAGHEHSSSAAAPTIQRDADTRAAVTGWVKVQLELLAPPSCTTEVPNRLRRGLFMKRRSFGIRMAAVVGLCLLVAQGASSAAATPIGLTTPVHATKNDLNPGRLYSPPTFAVDPGNSLRVLAAVADHRSRRCHIMRSTDGGQSWNMLEASPALASYPFCSHGQGGVIQAPIAFGRNGTVYLAMNAWDDQDGARRGGGHRAGPLAGPGRHVGDHAGLQLPRQGR